MRKPINCIPITRRDPSRLEEADALYREAISMRADYVQAYINRGDVLLKLNRSDEAQEVSYPRTLLNSAYPKILRPSV